MMLSNDRQGVLAVPWLCPERLAAIRRLNDSARNHHSMFPLTRC